MKKFVLFNAMVLLTLTSATVSAGNAVSRGEDQYNATHFRFAQPIQFVERGITFLIFPDGSFDFNTESFGQSYQTEMYYRTPLNTRRGNAVNVTFGAPGTVNRVHYATPRNNGVLIQHDIDGKVRRIGNVFINYDREGRIKRAGTVYMSYMRGRNGSLRQVGGLRVNYNVWGEIVHITGVVNAFNTTQICEIGNNNQQDSFGYGDFNNFNDTETYYYYRQNGKVKKQKKNKIKA
jgi:hypothetical protein